MATTTNRSTRSTAPACEAVMEMLHGHVPLALLLDVADPHGPASHEILEAEGGPEDHWWEPREA